MFYSESDSEMEEDLLEHHAVLCMLADLAVRFSCPCKALLILSSLSWVLHIVATLKEKARYKAKTNKV